MTESEAHLEILTKGVWDWNAWRKQNPEVRPNLKWGNFIGSDLRFANLRQSLLIDADLRLCDLRNTDLSGADLTRANFYGQDLREALLREASFEDADLRKTNLAAMNFCRANFCGAKLTGANLTGAYLTEANFSNADLTEVNLSGATVTETNFEGAIFGRTILGANDLTRAIGLEAVRHRGPSTLGVDTLYMSGGNLPEVFLRGVGLPEVFITYVPSLIQKPLEFYSCFISYSHADKSFARRLHDTLQGRGIRCWLDEYQLLPGDKIYTEVDRGIRLWDKVLLCCSEKALTSWWVNNEIETAFAKEQAMMRERGKEVLVLIPLNLDGFLFRDDCENSKTTQIKTRLVADFTGWEGDYKKFDEEMVRLMTALRTDTGRKSPPPLPNL